MPGAGLVVVEAEFILGGLEAVLDGPAMSFQPNKGFNGRAGRAPGREEGPGHHWRRGGGSTGLWSISRLRHRHIRRLPGRLARNRGRHIKRAHIYVWANGPGRDRERRGLGERI